MTTNPHVTRLERDAAQAERELADLISDRSEWWREQAEKYAAIADNLLNEWRKLAAKRGQSIGHYDPDGD